MYRQKTTRKPATNTYRYSWKKYNRRRIPRGLTGNTISTRLVGNILKRNIIASPTDEYVSNSYTTSLSSLNNYAEWTNVFDRFRINKVVYKYWWGHNSHPLQATASAAANSTTQICPVWTCCDYDSNNTINYTQIVSYRNSKVHFGPTFTVAYKPATLNAEAGSVTTYNNKIAWNQWVDCGYPDTSHYGHKTVIYTPAGTEDQTLYFVVYAYVTFAGQR